MPDSTPPAASATTRRRFPPALTFALRIAVSVALIAWATRRIDWAEAAGRLRSASPGWLLLAIAVVALTVALTGERWRVLLARLGWPLAHALTLRFAAIGHFFNQGLPSTIGGDAMRVWLAHREGVPVGEAVRSVLLERLSGLATLLLLALAGFLVWFPRSRLSLDGVLVDGGQVDGDQP